VQTDDFVVRSRSGLIRSERSRSRHLKTTTHCNPHSCMCANTAKSSNPNLARDELEAVKLKTLKQGVLITSPQVACAIGAPTSTMRWRLCQMVAADVIRSDWRRGSLFWSLSKSENDTVRMRSETKNSGVSRRIRNADEPAITRRT